MGSKGGGEHTTTSTGQTDVTIPAELKPLINLATSGLIEDIPGFRDLISDPELLNQLNPAFTGDANQSFAMLRELALNPNSPLYQAQGALGRAAAGFSAEDLLGGDVAGRMRGSFTSDPRQLGQFLDPDALSALQQQARGDLLVGGKGFDPVFDEAVREAERQVKSRFRGGSSLGQVSMGREVGNIFRAMAGEQQERQQRAATMLSQLGAQEAQRATGERLGYGNILSQLGLGSAQLGTRAAALLPEFAMAPANILSGIDAQRRGMSRQRAQDRLNLAQQGITTQAGIFGATSPMFGQSSTGTQTQPIYETSPLGAGLGFGLGLLGLF